MAVLLLATSSWITATSLHAWFSCQICRGMHISWLFSLQLQFRLQLCAPWQNWLPNFLTMYIGYCNGSMGDDRGLTYHALSWVPGSCSCPALSRIGALPLMKSYPSFILISHILLFPQHCPHNGGNALFFFCSYNESHMSQHHCTIGVINVGKIFVSLPSSRIWTPLGKSNV